MKTIAVSILALVLFTFCAVSTVNAQQQGQEKERHFAKGMKGMMAHRNELIKKLNLTDQQKDKIADLRTSFQKSMVDLKADFRKNQIDLKSLKSKDNVSREDVISAVEKVNKSRDAMTLALANHLYDVYQILTPEQQKIAKESKLDMHMGGRGRMGFGGGLF